MERHDITMWLWKQYNEAMGNRNAVGLTLAVCVLGAEDYAKDGGMDYPQLIPGDCNLARRVVHLGKLADRIASWAME